ncbi:hypothetical protein [Paracoccus aminovorans]|uniref:hypothetical protein n=1 Tax=Paracoccus aminovorans TaxID=34004 RepID=UPI0018D50EC5|nr:hypothetical protein [Paracoccus aminovorans]
MNTALVGYEKIAVDPVASRGADRAAAYAGENGPRWHDSYSHCLPSGLKPHPRNKTDDSFASSPSMTVSSA